MRVVFRCMQLARQNNRKKTTKGRKKARVSEALRHHHHHRHPFFLFDGVKSLEEFFLLFILKPTLMILALDAFPSLSHLDVASLLLEWERAGSLLSENLEKRGERRTRESEEGVRLWYTFRSHLHHRRWIAASSEVENRTHLLETKSGQWHASWWRWL